MSPEKKKTLKILKIRMRKAVYKIRRYLFGLSVMGAVASSPATLSGQVRAEGNGGGKENAARNGRRRSVRKGEKAAGGEKENARMAERCGGLHLRKGKRGRGLTFSLFPCTIEKTPVRKGKK